VVPEIVEVEVAQPPPAWRKARISASVVRLTGRGQKARGGAREKVTALDAGADDYVEKPFGTDELLARIRVGLRRGAGGGRDPNAVFTVGGLTVDRARRVVAVHGHAIHLTPIEHAILTILVHHAGKVVTHRQLLRDVWGPTYLEHGHYLRIYMGQLRRKIERDPAQPRYLLTEPGIGYRPDE
jgi:two-component system KDP operon response regulator KdpE